MDKNMPSVVVIGGGTGTSTVLSGLKNEPIQLTALVSVADSGGSTGRLRDEFGFQPVGDLRQSLAALAKENSQDWIRKLLLYRFEKGEGLKGHNLGNLILTALQDMAGSTSTALEIAEHIFRLNGNILPVTTENVRLVIEYTNGTTEIGEDKLNVHQSGKHVKHVRLSPQAVLYDASQKAILKANLIIIGPGDFYASLIAAISVKGIPEAFKKTKAKIVYVVNLMTRYNQTNGMTAKDHLDGIEKMIGRSCDVVIVNTGTIPKSLLMLYTLEEEYPVSNDLQDDPRYLGGDIVSYTPVKKSSADILERSLLRHDSKKLARMIMRYI